MKRMTVLTAALALASFGTALYADTNPPADSTATAQTEKKTKKRHKKAKKDKPASVETTPSR